MNKAEIQMGIIAVAVSGLFIWAMITRQEWLMGFINSNYIF